MKNLLTVGVLFALALVLSFCVQVQPAHAGFVSMGVQPKGEPAGHGPPEFVWDLIEGKPGNAWATLNELFHPDFGDSYDLTFSGITNSDPIVTITKNVTNTTLQSWIGYNIDLDPLDTDTFVGTPTSDKMTLVGQTAFSLDFGLPAPIGPGETVQFVFDINVPDVGPFSFDLYQEPVAVPEPASIALLGLATLLAAGCWRRK